MHDANCAALVTLADLMAHVAHRQLDSGDCGWPLAILGDEDRAGAASGQTLNRSPQP